MALRSSLTSEDVANATTTKVVFTLDMRSRPTAWGENIFVVGSIPELGSWVPENGLRLHAQGRHGRVWSGSLVLPRWKTFQPTYSCVEYKFVIVVDAPTRRRAKAYEYEGGSLHDNRKLQLEGVTNLEIELEWYSVCQWAKAAVFYHIFPDRFAYHTEHQPPHDTPWHARCAGGFMGGTLRGALRQLPHLASLGITAVYLGPIFSAASYHRYDTIDYFEVDERLGGDEAFREFLRGCAAHGIEHVILDGVFNHISSQSPFFLRAVDESRSATSVDEIYGPAGSDRFDHCRMFRIRGLPLRPEGSEPANYDCYAGCVRGMPELNFDQSHVRELVLRTAEYWTEFGRAEGVGIGWRLDHPSKIPPDFWHAFRATVRASNPKALVYGEHEPSHGGAGFCFDAVEGRHPREFRELARDLGKQFFRGNVPARQFAAAIAECLDKSNAASFVNCLSSHDPPGRFLDPRDGRNDDERAALLKFAATFLFVYPGIVGLYYGDELGMENSSDHRDEGFRDAFPFLTDGNTHGGEVSYNTHWNEHQQDILRWWKHCIAFFKAHPALHGGTYHTLLADDGGVFVCSRRRRGTAPVIFFYNTRTAPENLHLTLRMDVSEQLFTLPTTSDEWPRLERSHDKNASYTIPLHWRQAWEWNGVIFFVSDLVIPPRQVITLTLPPELHYTVFNDLIINKVAPGSTMN